MKKIIRQVRLFLTLPENKVILKTMFYGITIAYLAVCGIILNGKWIVGLFT